MMRSLFSGVSGLRNHQVRMDVIGNNVANVNTVGFKSGRVTFKEGFAQLLQGASRPPGDHGGINPIQVGLGTQIGSIDTLYTQGNIESTGINTDLAITGDAMFVVAKGNEHYYTRAGNFQLDAGGKLVSPTNGFVVQGRMAVNGQFTDGIQDIKLPFGQRVAARPTTYAALSGNVNAAAPVFLDANGNAGNIDDPAQRGLAANQGAYTETTITVFDSLGTKHELKMTMWKTESEPQTWKWQVLDPTKPFDPSATPPAKSVAGEGTFEFDEFGKLKNLNLSELEITFKPDGADDVNIKLDPLGTNGLSSYAAASTAVLRDQDGYTMGTLQNFSIDRSGVITGAFSNGTSEILGQIVLADFNNPSGLLRIGDNMYATSGNSGGAVLGFPLEGSQSFLTSNALEMSNVDLAQEFTSMIVAQRGFQANGRVITSSDEMLQEVVNLKR